MNTTLPEGNAADAALATRDICVLLGGRSSEREVSLASGRAMLTALETTVGRADGPRSVRAVELTPDGRWAFDGRAFEPARALVELPEDAVFVLALHGGEGEGGVVQGLLEATGRAFTGAGVAASALCLDKHLTRLALAAAGIAVAPGWLVRPAAWRGNRAAELARVTALGGGVWFVKPNRGGSSLGVSRVDDAAELGGAIERVLAAGDAALVERRVEGVEATCGVLGNRGDELRVLPPVEIRPRTTGFFDYGEKYSDSGALELCPPEEISAADCARIGAAARTAHVATGCDGVSRTDFIVPADGGPPLALEVNTLPGMTARSLVPRSAAAVGMDFTALCLELVRLSLAAERGRPA